MAASLPKRRGIVTGAGSGIGQAVARRMLREGVEVIACDIDAAKLKVLEAEGCSIFAGDLSDPAVRAGLAAQADEADYLVNSHGIIMIRPIFELTVEEWRKTQTVNAESIFFLCQQIGPKLKSGGAIVNLSSSSAKLASTIEVAAYAASKTAITSITRSFAYALAPRNVRVNCILPGIVNTPMQDAVLEVVAPMRGTTKEAWGEVRNKVVPLGRGASPDECANLIWFLLSSEANYMTGQSINYTGGHITW